MIGICACHGVCAGICAHLVQHWGLSADQALLAYENARTVGWSTSENGAESQGVSGQSQIRYVHYYAQILAQHRVHELYSPPSVSALHELYIPPSVSR